MTMCVPASRVYFTADTHFFHKAMLPLRGFTSVEEMNYAMIRKWNDAVPRDGIVFHLGDVSFSGLANTMGVLGQLNGTIHLVKGNHDYSFKNKLVGMFASVQDYLEINVEEKGGTRQRIVLNHYSHRVWNQHHYGAWHLYGHSHGNLPGIGRSMDVGVDTIEDFIPYSYELVKLCMSHREVHVIDHHKKSLEEM